MQMNIFTHMMSNLTFVYYLERAVSRDLAFFKNDLLSTLIYPSAYVHIVLLECHHVLTVLRGKIPVLVSYAQKNTPITIAKRALNLTAEENIKIW